MIELGQKTFNFITNELIQRSCNFTVIDHKKFKNSDEAALLANIDRSIAIKSLLLKSSVFHLVVLRSLDQLSSSKLRKINNSNKLRFANISEVNEIMDCEPGTCHPFGKLIGLSSFIDVAILSQENIAFSAGLRTRTILMPTKDFIEISASSIVDISN